VSKNFFDKYASVENEGVEAKCFSHFSAIVRMPVRMAATGLVKVKGNKF
jgi:hypothetical protein